MKQLTYIFLFLILLSPIASAGDEVSINEQLKNGGNVHLPSGIYNIEGPIYIKSDTVFSGESDTILRVSCPSGRWFTNALGVINGNGNNIEISGFQVDGNVENLPTEYSHTRSDTAHDCENLIRLQGESTNFMNNIKVHDMKLYDSFGDGCHVIYCQNAQVYNNFISNTQHEGIFWSVVTNSEMYNNKIAAITSDAARLDNCVNCKVYDSVFFSYSGDHNAGEWEHGENGLQVGDGGVSHGYDARNAPTSTTNIEITNNTFANNGLKSILLGSNSDNNVYIHGNQFIGEKELETMGVPVESMSGNVTYTNPPTVEMSENIFGSSFDILNHQFSTTALIPQINQLQSVDNWQKKGENTEATLSIGGFRNLSEINGVEYIPGKVQDNVIVNSKTRNNALLSAGQTSNLSYQENNTTLTVILTVYTNWYTKSSNSITFLGKRLTIPSISTKSESEVYYANITAPKQFPETSEIQANITYYNNSYNPHSIISLTNAWGIVQETYTYNGSEANHFKLVGEVSNKDNNLSYVNYSKLSTWKTIDTQIRGYGNDLYISGKFNPALLNVSVTTPYETVEISNFNITEVPDESGLILNPSLWTFVGTLSILGFFIYRNLKRVIRKY